MLITRVVRGRPGSRHWRRRCGWSVDEYADWLASLAAVSFLEQP